VTYEFSSEELLLRMAHSHPDTATYFEILYERFQNSLFKYFTKKGLSLNSVEDLIQLTFIQMFEKRSRYRAGASAEAWVFVIARSQFLNWMREQKRQIKQIELYSDYLESQLEKVHSHSWKSESLIEKSTLTQDELRLLSDRFEKGLTFEEMAKSWGMSASSLRKRASRLYQFLKLKKEANE
jgi:RNA polymerase sigma-70 factor (ECF subfamily)